MRNIKSNSEDELLLEETDISKKNVIMQLKTQKVHGQEDIKISHTVLTLFLLRFEVLNFRFS